MYSKKVIICLTSKEVFTSPFRDILPWSLEVLGLRREPAQFILNCLFQQGWSFIALRVIQR